MTNNAPEDVEEVRWEDKVLQESARVDKPSIDGDANEKSPAEEALMSLEQVEKRHIKQVLERVKNLDRASEILGITTVTLWRKRKQYGIS